MPQDARTARTLLLAATLLGAALGLAHAAHAADFRALDFGARCENLAALEAARGSTPYEGQLPSGYAFAYRGRYADRDAIIGYGCLNGIFYRGAYIFQAAGESDATRLYGELRRTVTGERGKPSYDFASAAYRKKMQAIGATLSRSDTEVAFWNTGNTEAHLSVAEPAAGRGWRVSLSYTDVTRAPPQPAT